jgi:hypothetical protein
MGDAELTGRHARELERDAYRSMQDEFENPDWNLLRLDPGYQSRVERRGFRFGFRPRRTPVRRGPVRRNASGSPHARTPQTPRYRSGDANGVRPYLAAAAALREHLLNLVS